MRLARASARVQTHTRTRPSHAHASLTRTLATTHRHTRTHVRQCKRTLAHVGVARAQNAWSCILVEEVRMHVIERASRAAAHRPFRLPRESFRPRLAGALVRA
eukprot:6189653-Pleurochrysis_carterae.AAC.1